MCAMSIFSLDNLSIFAAVAAAAFSGISVWQNFNLRKHRFSFSVEREKMSCPSSGDWTHYTVTCVNQGESAKVVKLFLVFGGTRFLICTGGRHGDSLPKFISRGDSFETWFSDTEIVGGEGVPDSAVFEIEFASGSRYKSAPLHKCLR